jgi:hypothetical protein
LYSDFNLPADVTVVFKEHDHRNVNIDIVAANPDAGGPVPEAVMGTNPDEDAVSG